jgi:tripartite-type tricarboxylate transporter receptor subunit TctC
MAIRELMNNPDLKRLPPAPSVKPHWMSQDSWEDHLEEQKAYAKRIYRHSGGRVVLDRLKDYPDQKR